LPEYRKIRVRIAKAVCIIPNAQHNSRVSEFKCRRADGTSFPVEVAMSQVNVTDAPLCTCIIRDINDRKEVERRRSRL
jgi:PAS domain S-box-containing protein